ncbi:hypothetical protein AWM75_08510 [Aerococcus urinaehominis]|uniref:Uncharacterized protein n=1 Tax=Aerococcus urinaehominis TaxID=128944 RepID=A0A0X8FMI9_9LACT|nr:hypothetical protein [Aerococcus urinaehominis]AMC00011.1 hypothetical protein AWM75_08510 [Aerococcus urinaehominis]SDL81977.1 hypothetical protein SAMN04487985_101147 [Aerococcus urinaehominis]
MKKLASFGQVSIWLILLVLVTGLGLASLFLGAEIYGFQEFGRLIFLTGGQVGLLILALALLVGLGFILKKVPSQWLALILAVLYLLAGLYLIWGTPPHLRADPRDVMTSALNIRRGNYENLLGYLGTHPHQLGLVSFERFFFKFSQATNFFHALYLALTMGSHALLIASFSQIFGWQDLKTKYLMVLGFLFTPALFFIKFIYGSTPALFLICASIFFLTQYFKSNAWYWALGANLSLAAAAIIRNNFLIAIIALCITYLIYGLKSKTMLKQVLASLTLIGLFWLGGQLQVNHYQEISGVTLDKGMPKNLYLAMGLQADDRPEGRFPGWYNRYNNNVYKKYYPDTAAMEQAAAQEIRERVHAMVKAPQKTGKFFLTKIASTWLDPNFESVWSGPMISKKTGPFRSDWLKNIYQFKGNYQLLVKSGHVLLTTGYLFAAVALVGGLVKPYFADHLTLSMIFTFISLCFIGTFIFHLFWETKSQYVFTHFYLLLSMAAFGLGTSYQGLSKLLTGKGVKN